MIIEYVIGSGVTLGVLWVVWVSHRLYVLSAIAQEAGEALGDHKGYIEALLKASQEDEPEEEAKNPVGFVTEK